MMNNSKGIAVIAVIVTIVAILAIAAAASSVTVNRELAIGDPNERGVKGYFPGGIYGITDPDMRSVK